MRRICDPGYKRRHWSEEHRARLSEIHRKRWGAPEGFATVRGVHVPFEYRDALRYWTNSISATGSEEEARRFAQQIRDNDWRDMPRIQRLYEERMEIAETREQIRRIQWELQHGHSDHS